VVDAIDWGAAQRIGELVAGSPPYGGVRAASVEPLAYDFARRVSAYSGLEPPTELPALEAVDRPAWIAANLKSMRPLLGALTERSDGPGAPSGLLSGVLSGPLRSASGFLLGAQVGALTGMLSQRVLGQYDLALLDASVPPRLLLLAPNLALTAGSLDVDRDELVLWVTIHEITHAVQFSGAPWLRDHLGGMLRELIEGLQVTIARRPGDAPGEDPAEDSAGGGGLLGKLPNPAELREMADRARRGELLRLTLGEDRWQLVERMQAVMSLIEGHAEHTMDAIGAEVLPSLPRLRAAMNHRREVRGLPWRVLERLLGLGLKMRQYEVGRRFCDAVVKEGGPPALARAWSGPDALPSTAELKAPAQWLERTRAS
jgi:putative hydrolase